MTKRFQNPKPQVSFIDSDDVDEVQACMLSQSFSGMVDHVLVAYILLMFPILIPRRKNSASAIDRKQERG
ncbi:hypothetical protein HALLA_05725 [Halostagnicola larsenii XH-48]|uniref:Uncharacterized protein n=1 Tax=Halostagnicola larsenii XH-48 TaxID=797299 RepID=W0JTZ7_9EURY|nr:hypothetical protein HALLA_05725 [Halostagnicola larsenii XH-48]